MNKKTHSHNRSIKHRRLEAEGIRSEQALTAVPDSEVVVLEVAREVEMARDDVELEAQQLDTEQGR